LKRSETRRVENWKVFGSILLIVFVVTLSAAVDTYAGQKFHIEAENYYQLTHTETHQWQDVYSPDGFSDRAAVAATPDNGERIQRNYENTSPSLKYQISFTETGRYYIWVRACAKGNDNSLHAGLNGNSVASSQAITLPVKRNWVWTNLTGKGEIAYLNVQNTGTQTLDVWMREDGLVLDKIILTTDASFVPTGFGYNEDPDTSTATETITDCDTVTETDTSTASDNSDPWVGSAAQYVLEAEDYNITTPTATHYWQEVSSPDNFSGSAAMAALPDTGSRQNQDYESNSPNLSYQIHFTQTGRHYVWVRAYAKGSDNSLHAGLNGQGVSTGKAITVPVKRNWVWTNQTGNGEDAYITVENTGPQSLDIWMREDGLILDKIVLTTDVSFVPQGVGPEDASSDGTDGSTETDSSDDWDTSTDSDDWGTLGDTDESTDIGSGTDSDGDWDTSTDTDPWDSATDPAPWLPPADPWKSGGAVNCQPPKFLSIGNRAIRTGERLTFRVSATDPDTAANDLTYMAANLPDGAVFNWSSRSFSWAPKRYQTGIYTVKFAVVDNCTRGALTAHNYVTIFVNEPPPYPSAGSETDTDIVLEPDNFTMYEDGTLRRHTSILLDNDTVADTAAAPLTILEFGAAQNGTVVLNDDDTFTYTPNPDYSGEDTFTYTVESAEGNTASSTVTVTITAQNDAPTISQISDVSIIAGQRTGFIPFSIEDPDTLIANLSVEVQALAQSPANLLPSDPFTLFGTSEYRRLRIQTRANLAGTATIGVTVSELIGDDPLETTVTFLLTVTVPSTDTATSTSTSTSTSTETGDETETETETETGTATDISTSDDTTDDPV
jgi:hypothetical protein